MKHLQVKIARQEYEYPIYIGKGLLQDVGKLIEAEKYSNIVLLTDSNTKKHWALGMAKQLKASLIQVKNGEGAKTLESLSFIWGKLLSNRCDRKSLLVNVGGGALGDIGGFAASTYMRGMPFVHIPTTLLAQVDASVGGKTGINFGKAKNMVGVFSQPQAVIIDVETLKTLPKREYVSGFAEIIKHGIIRDRAYFHSVTAKAPREYSDSELIEIIAGSCKIKRDIVEGDEKEQGLRKLLNFGHTLGHALEAYSRQTKYPLLHGEAVSIGMVAEAYMATHSGLLKDAEREKIVECLKAAGLPIRTTVKTPERVIEKLEHDKKKEKGVARWTLPVQIGKAVVDQSVPKALIRQALAQVS